MKEKSEMHLKRKLKRVIKNVQLKNQNNALLILEQTMNLLPMNSKGKIVLEREKVDCGGQLR